MLGDLYALWAVDLESADLAASPCSDSGSRPSARTVYGLIRSRQSPAASGDAWRLSV